MSIYEYVRVVCYFLGLHTARMIQWLWLIGRADALMRCVRCRMLFLYWYWEKNIQTCGIWVF